ncbi:hypothetical protein DRO69_01295 [Candidatus Bathyarchaeota archaeon]|nr:MAG: hypothetical protein DRO69_01295 [Candidatus Bathyarchaeota archaeon]
MIELFGFREYFFFFSASSFTKIYAETKSGFSNDQSMKTMAKGIFYCLTKRGSDLLNKRVFSLLNNGVINVWWRMAT